MAEPDEIKPLRFVAADDPLIKLALKEVSCGHRLCASSKAVQAALVLALSDDKIAGDVQVAVTLVAQVLSSLAQGIVSGSIDVVLLGADTAKPSHDGSAAVH